MTKAIKTLVLILIVSSLCPLCTDGPVVNPAKESMPSTKISALPQDPPTQEIPPIYESPTPLWLYSQPPVDQIMQAEIYYHPAYTPPKEPLPRGKPIQPQPRPAPKPAASPTRESPAPSKSAPQIVDTSHSTYSYTEMLQDIAALAKRYDTFTQVESIGQSVMGQDLPVLVIGNREAPKKILIHGSIHGREYMTTQLIMAQIESYLQGYSTQKYRGIPYDVLLNDIALHFIPMLNPDGVTLSQKGVKWIEDKKIRSHLLSLNGGSTNFSLWKANIHGVDLNRNFDAKWSQIISPKGPASQGYKGLSIESEPESKAIASYTREQKFTATLSYHAKGSILYWYFLQTEPEYSRDRKMAQALGTLTRYSLVSPSKDFSAAGGYKDWYVLEFNKPGFTLEIGSPSSKVPLSIKNFPDIWKRNRYVPLELAYLLRVQDIP